MKNYKIYYYAEINYECADLEETLQADNIIDAYIEFNTFGIIH
jgi:hypothetical protein